LNHGIGTGAAKADKKIDLTLPLLLPTKTGSMGDNKVRLL
jgi:hypothetical protein